MSIEVKSLNMHPLENAMAHQTEKFELVHSTPRIPVIRRGKAFQVSIELSGREFDPQNDVIRLLFNYGPQPNFNKGTQGLIDLQPKVNLLDCSKWMGYILLKRGNIITAEVIAPNFTPFGPWEVIVEILNRVNNKHNSNVFTYDNDLWILMNPWNKEDTVHMPDVVLLDEYVLSDVGKIWVGPYSNTRGREWVYGQFDECVLPATLKLLDRANVPHSSRGDPIIITRAISRIVNSNDDRGLLVGRWDANYKDGTAPSTWTGSIEILDEFLQTDNEVKYGQCWVFAGVSTTIARAIGIPSRPVSNLVSAHDTNGTLTVDKYYDEKNSEIEDPDSNDSIWNYHVWNEMYMARPDLPKGYGGWQATDATPQESSDGAFQLGPCSLQAIKKGVVGLKYDVPFMIASVNADLMKWRKDETCPSGFKRIDCNKYHIGRMILTKKPHLYDPNGDRDREDITHEYKNPEGTKDERLALYNAVGNITRAKRFYEVSEDSKTDVEFELVDLDKVLIGEPFVITAKLENKSSELRTVEVALSVSSVYYTGIKAAQIMRTNLDVLLLPNGFEKVEMKIHPNDYLRHLVEYCNMKSSIICNVRETAQSWAEEDDFQIITPDITIKVPQEVEAGRAFNVMLSFPNPLKETLTKCSFSLSSPGLLRRNLRIPYRNARPHETVKVTAQFLPEKSGLFKIVATFVSDQLVDVTGSAALEVM